MIAVAWEGDTSVVAELLKRGANATRMNSERRSALMLAESEGHRAVVKLLAVKGDLDRRRRACFEDCGDLTQLGLADALTAGFGPPAAAVANRLPRTVSEEFLGDILGTSQPIRYAYPVPTELEKGNEDVPTRSIRDDRILT